MTVRHLRDCNGNPCECGADPNRFVSADRITIGGVRMTRGAAELVQWAGINPAADVERMRKGELTPAALAIECLDGVTDPVIAADWGAYVVAIELAAGGQS